MQRCLDAMVREYVRACFAGLWIRSDEHEDALTTLATVCREEGWRLAAWDLDGGMRLPTEEAAPAETQAHDPLAAVRMAAQLADGDTPSLMVLENFHRFLGSAEVVQATARQVQVGKRQRSFVVVLAPVVDLPPELEKLFVVVDHELPDREQLAAIARELFETPDEVPPEECLDVALDAAAGLTRFEAEGAFALSLVRDGELAPRTIWEVKAQQLKKSALLTLHEGGERFADLGGLAALKEFCRRALATSNRAATVAAKGVLLLSPAGCGKSAFCKALGNEVGRPTLRLDVGALMGSLVGQTEANVRRAIATAEAMAPCVLMVDEIDKGLAGVRGGGQADGGVAARLFGTLLTWLADRTSDVFVVATANSVADLPPEFTRAERFDGVFFVDLPERAEKDAIWGIHRAAFAVAADEPSPADEAWTGAEIRACCRLAALLDVPLAEAARHVVPVATSSAEQIDQLRRWAGGRCLSADRPGAFQYAAGRRKTGARRGIRIDPSAN